MIIIGVSGKKQSGKSTFVDHLQSRIPGSGIVRFADSLKQIILDCFVPPEKNLNKPEDLDLEEVKSKILPCGKTIRELLQVVGTDWFRYTWQECWINAYKKKIFQRPTHAIFLTPDVRFPNELKVIQEMGGVVIRLLRAPFRNQDQHESETALDEVERNCTQTILQSGVRFNYLKIAEIVPKKVPGRYFNLLYNNSGSSLEDTQKWIDEKFTKCFSWISEQDDGVSNVTFDLRRLVK